MIIMLIILIIIIMMIIIVIMIHKEIELSYSICFLSLRYPTQTG